MTSNEKSLDYKVVDLVESCNFYINFILIQIHTKSYDFFREVAPAATGNGDMNPLQYRGGLL
jgi:hypothetical protein